MTSKLCVVFFKAFKLLLIPGLHAASTTMTENSRIFFMFRLK